MNRVILMGRLTADPEVRYSQGENSKAVARYRLAVDRRRANADGTRDADFINCVAFGKSAEFAERFLHKGTKIAIEGLIRTGKYQNRDGQTVYTTDVVGDRHEFGESRGASQGSDADSSAGPAPARW